MASWPYKAELRGDGLAVAVYAHDGRRIPAELIEDVSLAYLPTAAAFVLRVTALEPDASGEHHEQPVVCVVGVYESGRRAVQDLRSLTASLVATLGVKTVRRAAQHMRPHGEELPG